MATKLRKLYEVLGLHSTAAQQALCDHFINKLRKSKSKSNNLADLFAKALQDNEQNPSLLKIPFIPQARKPAKRGTNCVTSLLANQNPIRIEFTEPAEYEFEYLDREVPHLRADSRKSQTAKAWIDYVGRTEERAILGEVKWKSDQNAFYALIQLLAYLSEIATTSQIERALRYELFGAGLTQSMQFDLHIFLGNPRRRGKKGRINDSAGVLAAEFKRRLREDYPEVDKRLRSIMCIAAETTERDQAFGGVKCAWSV